MKAGVSQFHDFIQDYDRVALDPEQCTHSLPKVANKNLTVWVNDAENWTRLPKSEVAEIFNTRLEGSVCNLLFKNVFGLSARYYQAFKHSLAGRTRVGANGLYVHKTKPGLYAIVVRLPTSFASWPLRSALVGASIVPAVMAYGWVKGKR